MIIHRKTMKVELKDKLREGEGRASVTHLVPAETRRHCSFFAEVSLEPGSSIGRHDHPQDIEYYIILRGTGTVNDNGSEVTVRKGDVVITGNGSFHDIKSTGPGMLDMIAVIMDL
ncbi:MAG: cupin domain-containing protein [Spirochaetaceae bacterium]|jgi:mannose-6-phosphate isomerase-like protein (cupin superfamily)|nr:cupin domain-containing protein [Spirochaetaceae bacterium]